MVTHAQAMDAIVDRWKAAWDAVATPFSLDNEAAKPTAPWARFVVRHRDSGQESLGIVGNRQFLRKFEIVVQIFTASDVGRKPGDSLAAAARAIFEGTTFSGVRCHGGQVVEVGNDPGGLFQHQARIVGDYNEVK